MEYMCIHKSYAEVIGANPILNREDELALVGIIRKFKSGKQKQDAREKLINSNLRMVLKEAFHYGKISNVPVEDLIGAGCEGLCIAIDRFKPRKYNTKLSTYAAPWIRLKIIRLLEDCRSEVHIPRHIIEQGRKYRKFHNDPDAALTDKELMKELDVSGRGLSNIRLAQGRVMSLQQARYVDDSGNETAMGEIIADTHALPANEIIGVEETKEQVRKELAKLDSASRDILIRRYLSDPKEELHEIGKRMHISGERVRQIEYKALKKLRQRMKSRAFFGV